MNYDAAMENILTMRRRSHQSILKEINSERSLEGPMLKLKLQYFGHLMWRVDSLEKTLTVRKIECRRRRGRQRMRWLDSIIDSMDTSLSKLREIVKDREACNAAVHRVRTSQTWLPDWITFHIISEMDAYRLLVRMVLASWPTGFALAFLDANITST